jgi:NAD(P)H-hydrate epimerase
MATGGSGDVLTGILTGLLSQGYTSYEASILGVYVHGLSGDLASMDLGMDSLIAGDLINFLPYAFKKIHSA